MREVTMGAFTPQRKAIGINDKFGNKGIKQQQGSTVIKYDTLRLDGSTELRFFQGSANRSYPLSNTGSDGNKLGVGNSMVVERSYLTLIEYSVERPELVVAITPLSLITPIQELLLAEFGFSIANTEVIKTVPVLSWLPEFNKVSENALNTNFEFDTQVVVPPLLEYIATIRLPKYTASTIYALRLTIEGTGAIISPRATF
jgi:hypothetical protein